MKNFPAVLLVVFALLLSFGAVAQIPTEIGFQALITDNAGNPVADGNYDVTFRLYETAGGGTAIWEENRTGIAISNAILGIPLGQVTTLDIPFDVPYFLGITLAGNPEMNPRIPLTTTPYSHQARSIQVPMVIESASEDDLFDITSTGRTSAAVKARIDNIQSTNSPVYAFTNGIGAALFAQSAGIGGAGLFSSPGFGTVQPAVRIEASSTAGGHALSVNHTGTGALAVFQFNNSNVARIDNQGTGYFNGGVQSSGADVAEAFEVDGEIHSYEPGDVLAISTESDRTVTKSSEAYSTRVSGVYATKPGVLLTERNMDDPHEDTVPMGVIGVIPTKVSAENGAIRRGDLLVSANLSGHAMKGTDRSRMLGAVIGKALEDFDGEGTGGIR
nr:hypothetical protein [Calditrichia bacterium]